jgi:hypothetical protein
LRLASIRQDGDILFLIVSLFIISVVGALGAIFYPSVRDLSPDFTSSLGTIGSNAWVWFSLVCFLALYVLCSPLIAIVLNKTTQRPPMVAPEGSIAPTVTTSRDVVTTERIFVDVTPEYLVDCYKGRMIAEGGRLVAPYIDKWVKWSRTVNDVSVNETRGGIVWCDMIDSSKLIVMIFSAKWVERLSILKRGGQITVSGRLQSVSLVNIELANCELDD